MPEAVRGMSQTLANRYAKFFPWAVLPEADCSIYLDANTLVLGDLTPLIEEFLASGADIGLFPHRERSSLAEEFEFGRRVGKIPPADVEKGLAQLRRYREDGLPPDPPFTENAIIFRRHGKPGLGEAMDLWWSELRTLHPARPAEPALRAVHVGARGQDLGLELQVRESLLHALPAPARGA